MIFGIGTDILDRKRLDRGLDAAFIRRAYTDAERLQAAQRYDPSAYYATRFAAKEAVFKAISACVTDFRPQDIETLADEHGKPGVFLHGKTAEEVHDRLAGREYSILVSLSCEDKTAIAYAVIDAAQ